jgi:sugar lactone lactonase YvrE
MLWPTGVSPEVWTAPAPFVVDGTPCASVGGFEQVKVMSPAVQGPEAIFVDDDGTLVTGIADGSVVRVTRDGARVDRIGTTGGRPLGIKKMHDGRYVIADAEKGLLAMSKDGAVEVLAGPFKFADDVDVGKDGTIYFTDASQRFGVQDWKKDILEHGRSGRLLAYDPSSKQVRVVVDGLSFANGVALGEDDSSVVFTETNEYTLKRHWLGGDKRGTTEVLAHLPGFPDNVTRNGRRFWVAIGSPRDPVVDALAGWPRLRNAVLNLPEIVQPKPKAHSYALAIDDEGKIVACLQRVAPDAYAPVASVIEHDGTLFMGSFRQQGIAVAPAPL